MGTDWSRWLPPLRLVYAGGRSRPHADSWARSVLGVRLVAECGTDMTRWPMVKHFTSWLTLAPGNRISGGKVLTSRTGACPIGRQHCFGSWPSTWAGHAQPSAHSTVEARRRSARPRQSRPQHAKSPYSSTIHCDAEQRKKNPGADHYEERFRQRTIDNQRRCASALGFSLVTSELMVEENS